MSIDYKPPALRAKGLDVVGKEMNAWKAACTLETFVHKYIKVKSHGTTFATAAEVFENPKGDYSEHSVLLAALCRATGIPARVVFGYMYASGIFGGYVWVEVWIKDQWYPLDAVLGEGYVGATHITMSTSSLKTGTLLDALSNTTQGTGIHEIRILEFTHGNETVVVEVDSKESSR
jgi:transglutaminase-like putative cysteine protease